MTTITHKRGDTWRYVGYAGIKDAATNADIDLTGWTVAAQARLPDGALLSTFACAITDPAAQTYTMQAQTANWPIGLMDVDIQFTSPAGDIISTPTVCVSVVKDVTQ